MTINDIMNLALQKEFCKQVGADDLELVNDSYVRATKEEVTECYYGNMLIQDVIVGEYSLDEIHNWMDLEYEKEAKLCNADAFFGV